MFFANAAKKEIHELQRCYTDLANSLTITEEGVEKIIEASERLRCRDIAEGLGMALTIVEKFFGETKEEKEK